MCEKTTRGRRPRRESAVHTTQDYSDAYAGRTWENYRFLLAQLVEFAPPGRVLDVGAGVGLFVECCRRFGIRCVGVDGSLEGAALARARNLPVAVARIEDPLPFRDDSFQTVVCNQVVEHLHAETAVLFLREARRVLAPRGVLLIQSPSARDRQQRMEPGHINLYLPSRLRHEVRAAGFEVLAERNGPTLPLGRGRLMRLFFTGLMRATGWQDALSASANIIARRPSQT